MFDQNENDEFLFESLTGVNARDSADVFKLKRDLDYEGGQLKASTSIIIHNIFTALSSASFTTTSMSWHRCGWPCFAEGPPANA